MSTSNFELLTNLPVKTQNEIARIQAIPSGLRNSSEAAFLVALAPYLTNELISVDSAGLIIEAAGNTIPNGYTGFKKGARFIKKNSTNRAVYENEGDETSASFVSVENEILSEDTPVNAVIATATLTSDATAPSNGKKVVIGAITYTFKTALTTDPTTVPYEVLIGASAAESLDNLKLAINKGAGEGTNYSTGTVAHPLVTATTNTNTTQVIEAKTAGVAANDIATTTDSAHLSWGAAKMESGVDGTVASKGQIVFDSSYLYIAVDDNTVSDKNWRRISVGSAY